MDGPRLAVKNTNGTHAPPLKQTNLTQIKNQPTTLLKNPHPLLHSQQQTFSDNHPVGATVMELFRE